MEKTEKLTAVIQTLTRLFHDKDRLIGFDDWDAFVGCVVELQKVLNMVIAEEKVAQERVNNNGEL